MTKRTYLALAAIFLVVGILATANTIRLNNYIRDTLPRDAAQEQCNTNTIDVLTRWVETRRHRDDAMNARDDAAVAVLDQVANGLKASPESVAAWRDAVAADRKIRTTVSHDFETHPIPKC